MRLIDADALKRDISKRYPFAPQKKRSEFELTKSEILFLLDLQPTVKIDVDNDSFSAKEIRKKCF